MVDIVFVLIQQDIELQCKLSIDHHPCKKLSNNSDNTFIINYFYFCSWQKNYLKFDMNFSFEPNSPWLSISLYLTQSKAIGAARTSSGRPKAEHKKII